MKIRFLLFFLIFISGIDSYSQITFKDKIHWDSLKILIYKNAISEQKVYYLTFKGSLEENQWKLPVYQRIIPLDGYYSTVAYFTDTKYTTLKHKILGEQFLKDKIEIKTHIYYARHKPFLIVSFIPIRKKNGTLQLLTDFTLQVFLKKARIKSTPKFASNSVLSSGKWVKIAISNDGVYKLTFEQLRKLGFDNPQDVRVFANDFGQLPYNNWEYAPDDLKENIIYRGDDYILFFAKGVKRWYYDTTRNMITRVTHDYSDTAYVFLTDKKTGYDNLIKIFDESQFSVNKTVNDYLWYSDYEKNAYNVLQSGRLWFSNSVFYNNTEKTYSFDIDNLLEQPAKLEVTFVGRNWVTGNMTVSCANTSQIFYIPPITGEVGTDWGKYMDEYVDFVPKAGDNLQVTMKYSGGSSRARALLDYIVVNAYRKLVFNGDFMEFVNPSTVGQGNVIKFEISNVSSSTQVWDVTDPTRPKQMKLYHSGNTAWFVAKTDSLRWFIAFNPEKAKPPILEGYNLGPVANQNLHATPPSTQMIIVTYPDFKPAADKIAALHRTYEDLDVKVVTTTQVYNEYSSGIPDLVAIRNYLRSVYVKPGSRLKWVLLFGDGSYNNKPAPNNPLYIPTYQTLNSLNTDGYLTMTSDDFFAMMDFNEGDITNESSGFCDLDVGRLPVKSLKEAQEVANKIEYYLRFQDKLPWKNYLVLVADDASQNIFMTDAEKTSLNLYQKSPQFRLKKIYLDAYKAVVNFSGEEYPGAVTEIKNRVEQGSLIFSYLGHGNETVLASERVVTISDVKSWKNLRRLSFFVTGTCEFGRFDLYEPTKIEVSAGEELVLNPQGGAIGMLTTTRISYSSVNYYINYAFFNRAFDRISQQKLSFGEIIRRAKFDYHNYYVHEFVLLGDPALKLAYPENYVVSTITPDTLRALSRARIIGKIYDTLGNVMTDFNGKVYLTVYDKPQYYWTLNNDNLGAFKYLDYKNVVFSGKASVTNGIFDISFLLPKDIDNSIDTGKAVFYATDGNREAMGGIKFLIGGKNDTIIDDNKGPEIRLYLNDTNFVSGAITNQNPKVIAYLADETGINTTDYGFGHALQLFVDNQRYLVNEYFINDENKTNKGHLVYELSNLSPGKHVLTMKAYDLLNNPAQKTIEFYVVRDNQIIIQNVFNYPNPFVDKTAFYFEHNQVGTAMDVLIQIFTVSGRLVKTINRQLIPDSFLIGPIFWDGRDDYGQPIGRGVYIYILNVRTAGGKTAHYVGKLLKI